MQQKKKSIPLNNWNAIFSEGIVISRTVFHNLSDADAAAHAHRDNWHVFILQEKGTTSIEIDFQEHEIKPASVIYIHPNQVHRLIAFTNATISSWAINNESLKPEYQKLLEEITPVKPLPLKEDTFSIISETVSLAIKYAERKDELLYNALLKDNGNILVALVASQYLAQSKSTDRHSRFGLITKAFKTALEADFKSVKSPKDYAGKLNISPAYLNECVKNITGHSVSHHIQQRIILEAERLLYHSNKSVKEIAAEMGYDDYSYFIRLFVKVTGITPVVFRNKNHK